jgi:hypothetical protein
MIMTRPSDAQPMKHFSGHLQRLLIGTVFASTALSLGSAAQAEAFVDPAGDFIPSFVGQRNADLDVVTSEVTLRGAQLVFSARLGGQIGLTPGSLYVLGLDRGAGTPRFPVIAPGVLFDEVLAVTGNGVATVRDLIAGTATTLPANSTTISGDLITVSFPVSLAPSLGLAPDNYTWNLWPRTGAGNDNQISDFAPDNSNVRVTAATVPEPGTFALLGLGALGFSLLRGRSGYRRKG